MLLTFDMDSIKRWQVCFTYFLQSLLSSQHPHFKTLSLHLEVEQIEFAVLYSRLAPSSLSTCMVENMQSRRCHCYE